MNGLILRDYEKGDADAIAAIYGHYVENSNVTFDLEAPDSSQIDSKFSGMVASGHPLIVAVVNGEVAGFAYAGEYRSRPAYRFTCENAIYLAPQYLGRGIGSRLLAELIKRARKSGFRQMVAVITMGTKGSIALHKKHGFEILGEFPDLGYKFDQWHGIIHMQRKL